MHPQLPGLFPTNYTPMEHFRSFLLESAVCTVCLEADLQSNQCIILQCANGHLLCPPCIERQVCLSVCLWICCFQIVLTLKNCFIRRSVQLLMGWKCPIAKGALRSPRVAILGGPKLRLFRPPDSLIQITKDPQTDRPLALNRLQQCPTCRVTLAGGKNIRQKNMPGIHGLG